MNDKKVHDLLSHSNSERSFRNGLAKILSETGYEVINYIQNDKDGVVFGYSAVIEIDIIVKGDRLIVVEIKSSVCSSDVYIFMRKAEFYSKVSGKHVDKLLMITPYIDDAAKEIAEKFEIIICDSLSDIDSSIKRA